MPPVVVATFPTRHLHAFIHVVVELHRRVLARGETLVEARLKMRPVEIQIAVRIRDEINRVARLHIGKDGAGEMECGIGKRLAP